MYLVIFRASHGPYDLISGPYDTIEIAKENRKVSGDLVCTTDHQVVADESWLWDWELELKDQSYAYRLVHFNDHL